MSKDITVPNPPAFPAVLPPDEKKGWDAVHFEGMTLRDYFAAKVIQGIYSAETNRATMDKSNEWVEYAYDVANAMLLERTKQK